MKKVILFLMLILSSLSFAAKKLYVGTIVAIKIDVIPVLFSPNKEIAIGNPNNTKLLLNIP